MDRLVYLAGTGAKQLLQRQDTVAHNLANANTPGFRADLDVFRAVPAQSPDAALATRVFVVETTPAFDTTPGTMMATGRALDVAVEGNGYLAVQARDGTEAYTRSGGLDVGADGLLQTVAGLPVQGEGGPLSIPENARVSIGRDGTVSATTNGKTVNVVGRIKLVNPPSGELVKGGDGLLRTRDGNPATSDPAVRLVDGTVEGSNVNAIDAMVNMIAIARQFETQMRLVTTTDQNARDANKLLSHNA